MAGPFVSIITVNYNNAIGLEKTMTSIFSQSFHDFEFIIIDGKSSDGSVDLIKNNNSKIMHWISKKDSGIFNAMNKGIKTSKGQYLLFLNSGDVLTNTDALKDFINHSLFIGDIIYGDYKFKEGEKKYPDILYPAYFMKTSLPHQSTFFKKTVFNKMGLYDENYKMGADRAFYIKCYLSKTLKFQHIPYFLTLFDLSGISNNPDFVKKKKKEDNLLLQKEYGKKYQQYKEELERELKQKSAQRNSLSGIIKRITNRIKK